MRNQIDETHDIKRQSWVASANGHASFPIQNLPFGVFSPPNEDARGGVAIGDEIFDLKRALEAGLFTGTAEQAARAASGATLNAFMALGRDARVELRKRLSAAQFVEAIGVVALANCLCRLRAALPRRP